MLESQSKIFGLNNPSMILNDYQEAVNQASLKLCKANVALLQKRGVLLEKARKKLDDEGYNYKKKRSRSIKFGPESSTLSKPKRKYVQSDCRDEEMKKISSAIQSYDETIGLLQKQKLKYTNSERFLEAVEINKRILATTEEKQKKVNEMENLKKAIVRSNLAIKKNKRVPKQSKKSSTTLKMSPLKSWLNSKGSNDSSGDDTESLSSDSESEDDLVILCTKASEREVSAERKDEWMEVTNHDSNANEASCSTAFPNDSPILDEVHETACRRVSASEPPVLDEVQEDTSHCSDFL